MQKANYKKYWFEEKDLLKPIDWEYFNSLSERVKDALELYMRGGISIGKAAEIARLPYIEFDHIRAKARIPIRILAV
ncbi:MAG: hypothetical protein EU529_16675 [Promethearchaeota archaeon]|nr:MAG: hypothetical protein EU529_16675 [Candidatus Lokiarchaeota archaeon]